MAFSAIGKQNAVAIADEWKSISPENIDKLIEQYIEGGEASLKLYDGITHIRMVNLNKGKSALFWFAMSAIHVCVPLVCRFEVCHRYRSHSHTTLPFDEQMCYGFDHTRSCAEATYNGRSYHDKG